MSATNTRKALKWRCRRGMQEMDILLLRYLDEYYDEASKPLQLAFASLLEQQDDVLWDWLSGRSQPQHQDMLSVVNVMLETA